MYKIKLTFTEPLLGAVAKKKDVYTEFITEKGKKARKDELETIPDIEEIGTCFHMMDGKPIIYDYVIKGLFKDACSMLRRQKGTKSAILKSHKKVIDGLVFVFPRQILINLNGNELGVLERPLRAQTAKGERIALAKSDCAPAGSYIEFDVKVLGVVSKQLLKEWLDYGKLRGLGQWRNASYGRFSYEIVESITKEL